MNNCSSAFAHNLKVLREQKNLPQDKFANEIGYSKAIISEWENEKKAPNAIALITLSKYFKKSIDFLVGLEDELGNKVFEPLNTISTKNLNNNITFYSNNKQIIYKLSEENLKAILQIVKNLAL